MDTSLTLYLSITYLMFCSFPMGLSIRKYKSKSNILSNFIFGWIRPVIAIAVPYYMFWGGELDLKQIALNYALIVVLMSVLITLGTEISISMLIYKKIKVIEKHVFKNRIFSILTIILGVVIEELIYRGVAFDILKQTKLQIYYVIVITSFMYSINHVFLGWWSVITKFFWGIVLGIALYMSGNIIIPISIHLINNLIIYMIATKKITLSKFIKDASL